MDFAIDLIVDYANPLGENPIWHSDHQCLYWLDIHQGRIFRYDPQRSQAELFFEGDVIGGMTIQQDGNLLLFMAAGRIALLKDGRLTTIIEKIAGEEHNRFNDVIATPAGNVYCGTLSHIKGGSGNLYHLTRDRALARVIANVGIANGLGFSPDLSHFYFTDSIPARKIYRYHYHPDADSFHGETVFVHLPPENGLPDGLTVDAAGYVWSACWDGGKVIRFAPSGRVDLEIEIPGAKKITSVAFGGPDYTDLYVTTAGGDNKSENGENAGALFRIRSNQLQGRPEYRSNITIP